MTETTPPVETVTIPKTEYEGLQEDSAFLECLRAAGVDNWDGYGDACEMFHGDEDDEAAKPA